MQDRSEAKPGRREICIVICSEIIDEELVTQGLVEPRLVPLDGPAALGV
jgi:hypothetical protein